MVLWLGSPGAPFCLRSFELSGEQVVSVVRGGDRWANRDVAASAKLLWFLTQQDGVRKVPYFNVVCSLIFHPNLYKKSTVSLSEMSLKHDSLEKTWRREGVQKQAPRWSILNINCVLIQTGCAVCIYLFREYRPEYERLRKTLVSIFVYLGSVSWGHFDAHNCFCVERV